MTERAHNGHLLSEYVLLSPLSANPLAATHEPSFERQRAARAASSAAEFTALYEETIDFVHRGLQRLGLEPSNLDDAVQDVYIVVHKKLASFRGDSALRTWIYGIVLHVARTYRRSGKRAGLHGSIDPRGAEASEYVADQAHLRPDRRAETNETWRLLLRVLEKLDDEKREIFVLAELEELPIPEIAEILGLKLNTAYSRLRLARAGFETALERERKQP